MSTRYEFEIGDSVEYDNGKFGIVTGFHKSGKIYIRGMEEDILLNPEDLY